MSMYIVSYSKAHEARKEIGQFDTLSEAKEAARKAGAIGNRQKSGMDYVYNVDGHDGDDNFGIWIECPRRCLP